MTAFTLSELFTIGLGALIGVAIFTAFLAVMRQATRPQNPYGLTKDVVSIPPYSPQKALRRASSPNLLASAPPRPIFAYAYGFQGMAPKPVMASDETGPASAVTVAAIAADLL